MSDFVLYLGMIAAGYLAGAWLRRTDRSMTWLGSALMLVVMALVFTMGLRIGANEEVVSSLNLIGLYALVFTIVVLAFTGVSLSLVRKAMGLNRFGIMMGDAEENASAQEGVEHVVADTAVGDDTIGVPKSAGSQNSKVDKMTVRILLAVVCGLGAGLLVLRFGIAAFDVLDGAAAFAIRIGLCVLLVFIGLDLGMEGTVLGNMRKAGLRILVVPITAVIATLAAAVVCSLFLPVSLRECLAIGAGFGWYSLAPGIIMDQGYVTAGAISFLHNILRELLSILAIPIVARRVGYIECSGLGGATSMDVGLPVVQQSTNGITTVYAFVSGATLSILVPVLVPLVLAL